MMSILRWPNEQLSSGGRERPTRTKAAIGAAVHCRAVFGAGPPADLTPRRPSPPAPTHTRRAARPAERLN